jgi:hypothetical protein
MAQMILSSSSTSRKYIEMESLSSSSSNERGSFPWFKEQMKLQLKDKIVHYQGDLEEALRVVYHAYKR